MSLFLKNNQVNFSGSYKICLPVFGDSSGFYSWKWYLSPRIIYFSLKEEFPRTWVVRHFDEKQLQVATVIKGRVRLSWVQILFDLHVGASFGSVARMGMVFCLEGERLLLRAMCYAGICDLWRRGFRFWVRDKAWLLGAFCVAKFY